MKNQNIFTYTNVQDSIPKATAGTGTITARNDHRLITGEGTLFLAEVKIFDWIYMKSNNEFRKVVDIMSNTELIIDTKFDVDPNGSNFHITPKSRYRMVSWLVKGNNDAIIDGENFAKNEGNTFEKQTKGKTASSDYILPIDVDAATNQTSVLITVRN